MPIEPCDPQCTHRQPQSQTGQRKQQHRNQQVAQQRRCQRPHDPAHQPTAAAVQGKLQGILGVTEDVAQAQRRQQHQSAAQHHLAYHPPRDVESKAQPSGGLTCQYAQNHQCHCDQDRQAGPAKQLAHRSRRRILAAANKVHEKQANNHQRDQRDGLSVGRQDLLPAVAGALSRLAL